MKTARTLLRGLAVLESLSMAGHPISLTGVAAAVGLDKATAGRLLQTLVEAGYVRRNQKDKTYRLTAKVARLSSGLTELNQLRAVARPHLVSLRDELGETVHLGILDGDSVVYIDKIESTQSVRLVSGVGHAMPIHTTALGKAMLAWTSADVRQEIVDRIDFSRPTEWSIGDASSLEEDLELVLSRGYSIDDRENEEGATCVGAPILDHENTVVAAVSVSGPRFRILRSVDQIGASCKLTAKAISLDLAGGVSSVEGLAT